MGSVHRQSQGYGHSQFNSGNGAAILSTEDGQDVSIELHGERRGSQRCGTVSGERSHARWKGGGVGLNDSAGVPAVGPAVINVLEAQRASTVKILSMIAINR